MTVRNINTASTVVRQHLNLGAKFLSGALIGRFMSGAISKSGLQCRHGSELDTKIPRPKMPKTALPPELRRKMGLKPRKTDQDNDDTIWRAGSGVLAKTGSGRDGTYLKRRSGEPMSQRASALAQRQFQSGSVRANISRARLSMDGTESKLVLDVKATPKSKQSQSEEDSMDIEGTKRKSPRLSQQADGMRAKFEGFGR